MKPVEGGTFQMGNTEGRKRTSYIENEPAHSVTISSFYLGETEVTQALWKAVMGSNYLGETEVTQALWKAVMGSNPSYFKGDNLPVESMSWKDCQEFIRKLNQLTGRNFRLPTEAEWEFAARGGIKSRGFIYAGSNNIDDVAWYLNNSGDYYYIPSEKDYNSEDGFIGWVEHNNRTRVVKTKQPNELGLYDMSGNVFELCSDAYYKYTSSKETNPRHDGDDNGPHILRGGSWKSPNDFRDFGDACRVSARCAGFLANGDELIGFRLALSE